MNTQVSENWDIPNGCWKAVLDRFHDDEDQPGLPRMIFKTIPQHGLDKEYHAEMRFSSKEHFEKQMKNWLSYTQYVACKDGEALPSTYLGEFIGQSAKIDVGFEASERPLFDSKITHLRWAGTSPKLLRSFDLLGVYSNLPESEL